MTTQTTPKTGAVTPARLRETQARLGLTAPQFAAYLGASPHTLIKWQNGTRAAPAIAARLLDVLGTVEAMAPALHAHLVPEKNSPQDLSMSKNPV